MSKIKKFNQLVFLSIAAFLLSSYDASAQTPCGDIIGIPEIYQGQIYEERTPIDDCSNPFGADSPVPFSPEITIEGQVVTANTIVKVIENQAVSGTSSITAPAEYIGSSIFIFKIDGQDYRTINPLSSNTFNVEELTEGEYVAVISGRMLAVVTQGELDWKQQLKNFFVPTALAGYFSESEDIVVVPFSVVYEPLLPTAASNVLFLPGIMGSKLYEDSIVCDSAGGEQQRWFSADDCDQLRLKTDFTGQPLYPLYTKPNEASIIRDIFVISPLYGDFLDRLASEKVKGTMADYRAVPYDWRLKLDDILKTKEENGIVTLDQNNTYKDSYIYHSLQDLVVSSESGKVTIVAHSNGGLVAKALIVEMQVHNDPLLSKIDNLILVAVPQEGTPDAVLSILHGAELGGGFILDQDISRQIVNTAPFSHHLLPTESYFSGNGSSVQTPVIKIEPGSATDAWRAQFGPEINTHDGMYDFMSKDSGRVKPANDDLLQPEVVDNFLLNYADVAHVAQSTFVPPSTMKVAQVAGTGVSTISAITYSTDSECISHSIFSFFQCTGYRDKLGYAAISASDGDGTVVLPSALAMSENAQVDRVWVDLFEYNDDFSDRVHRNILEIPDVQDFIFNTVESTTSRQYNYLDTNEIIPISRERLVFQLHSPLDMWVSTQSGFVSSSTSDVSGAVYRRLGELQYIEVPASEKSVQVHLLGQKSGSFTLDTERWIGSSQIERVSYVAVPTATGTKVMADISATLLGTMLKLDLEGDGVVDADINSQGVLTVKQRASYPLLINTIEKLNLQKLLKQVLLALIRDAAYYAQKTPSKLAYRKLEDALLTASEELIKLYTKKRYISAVDSKTLLDMVKILKDKQ